LKEGPPLLRRATWFFEAEMIFGAVMREYPLTAH